MCAHSLHASDFAAVFTWITVTLCTGGTWGARRTSSPFDILTSPLNLLGGIFNASAQSADGRVRGISGGGGGNHGELTERQLDITEDPPFAAISPFLSCSSHC